MRLLILAVVACLPLAAAGQSGRPAADEQNRPAAPTGDGPQVGPSAIAGTVMDPTGATVDGAQVVLDNQEGAQIDSVQSGRNGEFSFAGLPSGTFKLLVSAQGWGAYVSPDIALHAGEYRIVTDVVLRLTASTFVHVTADSSELAEEQVHIAEQQRMLSVFPNYYTSFDWNAPPLGAKQKFQLAFRSIIDPAEFAGPAVIAGFEQAADVFPGYGGGSVGYAKRYGAAYANAVSAKFFAHAVYPSLFHQDPRYFYKGNGGFRARALFAISASVMTRSDRGRWEPNYSYILGTFTAGAISNLYYPAQNRSAFLTFTNGLADIAGESGANLVREFVFQRFTRRAQQHWTRKP
jgi:hypothetical protein